MGSIIQQQPLGWIIGIYYLRKIRAVKKAVFYFEGDKKKLNLSFDWNLVYYFLIKKSDYDHTFM